MGNRDKLAKVFGEGAFGVEDVPTRIGHGQLARVRGEPRGLPTREDSRSWKRRRKTRWKK